MEVIVAYFQSGLIYLPGRTEGSNNIFGPGRESNLGLPEYKEFFSHNRLIWCSYMF